MVFNESKTRTWLSGSTPVDGTPALGELFDAEFNRLYDNDIYLKNQAENLRGLITGGLQYRDSSHAPYICPGSYEISGKGVNIMALADSGANGYVGDQAPRANYWYLPMMDSAGAVKLQIACGARVGSTTYTINSISGSIINVAETVSGLSAGMIAYIEGITVTGERGGWAIASTGANTIVLLGTLTNQAAAAGTVKVYFRETTFHFGAGSEVGITTAADTEKYMPSHADALFSTPVVRDWSWYDPARNGYYSLFPGYTDYRILGCVYYAASTFTHVISYKSGRNKNDNVLFGGPLAAYASSVSAGNYFYGFAASNFKKIWGNDYIISSDSTNGFRITANRTLSGRIFCRVTLSVSTGADQISLYKNNETTGIFANLNTAGTIQSILSFEDILQAAHFLSFFRDSHALEEYVGSPTFRAEI